jgi:putative addiction module killer protein
MVEVRQTGEFEKWLHGLRDERAKARIAKRVQRLEYGNPGDTKPVGGPVHEMRIDYGPGYRVYYMYRGAILVILLCGGDKRTQQADIKRAQGMADNWRD